MQENHAAHRPLAVIGGKLLCALALALLAVPRLASAQVVDKIEVKSSGGEAEVVIRFLTPVQYQRHSPPTRGDNIRLYFQLAGLEGTEPTLQREVKTSPQSELIGPVTVTYPDANSAMTVSLPAVSNFRVRQGSDGRSISIFVPALARAGQSGAAAEAQATPVIAAAPVAALAASSAVAPTAAAAGVASVAPTVAAAAASGSAPTPPAEAAPPPAAAAAGSAEAPAAAESAAAAPSASVEPTVVPSSAEVEAKAKLYLAQAHNALEQNQPAPAVEALNNLLNLPPNSLSPQGQELIGLARERSGEFGKAKAEYELYLKLYPKGEGVPRVRERLAKLPSGTTTETAAAEPARRAVEDSGWKLYGGISQYRYHGESATTTEPLRLAFNSSGTTETPEQAAQRNANVNTVTRSVQNTLVSNIDATEEHRAGPISDKFVVRDVLDTNYQADTSLGQKRNQNRITTAYYERSDRDRAYTFRVGNQSGSGGGVLGQFNGVSGSYNSTQQLRLSGVLGSMNEYNSPYSKKVFGATVDLQPSQSRQWGGNAYFVEQRFENKADRAAVGGEARYFDAGKSFFGTLDYDVLFRGLNTVMLQANLQGASGTSYYATVDHRRSPLLLLSSALDNTPGVSLGTLFSQVGEKDVRADIKRMTPFSNSFAVGITYPYSERWQVGGDYRVSNLSSAAATESIPGTSPGVPYRAATPASGNTHSFSAQAIGNNLMAKNDMLVLNGSLYLARNTAAPYKAVSLSVNHVAVPNDSWRIDSALRLYLQRSDATASESQVTTQTRISPSLRGSYRLRNNWSFEVEGNIEFDRNSETSTSGSNRSTIKFIYAGYRWDWL